MKKFILIIAIIVGTHTLMQAQIIPKFQFGIKGGANLSKLYKEKTFSSSNRAGYLVGIWARAGAMGLHVQPELYYALKSAEVKDVNGKTGTVNFSSIDLPVLIGTKIGAVGIGARLQTGPVVSFKVSDIESKGDAFKTASKFNYKNQPLAWQFGAGLDIRKISFDLRYEKGLNNVSRVGYDDTKLNLFNFSVGYKLY